MYIEERPVIKIDDRSFGVPICMNRKQKQQIKDNATTHQLMGITDITSHSLVTGYGELVFFMVKPTSISVLSDASVGARIYALMNVLKGIAEIEMLCLNSRENFEDVKSHLKQRRIEPTLTARQKKEGAVVGA